MIALNRGRKVASCLVASATIGVLATQSAQAQIGLGRFKTPAAPARPAQE